MRATAAYLPSLYALLNLRLQSAHYALLHRIPCYKAQELSVDIQTRLPGSPGSFTRAGSVPSTWLEQNKTLAIRLSVAVVALLFVAIAGAIWINNRSQQARVAFSNAMDVYDSPVQQAGQPPIPNVKMYPSVAARAKDANPLFLDVANRYGLFKAGANARYFAGLTAEDMGNMASAETNLVQASNNHDAGLSALAKMALASLYSNSGRQTQAAALYRGIIDHPTMIVSANAARLALAASEESTNPQDARILYAKVKDSDKTTAAGEIATQKLSGK